MFEKKACLLNLVICLLGLAKRQNFAKPTQ